MWLQHVTVLLLTLCTDYIVLGYKTGHRIRSTEGVIQAHGKLETASSHTDTLPYNWGLLSLRPEATCHARHRFESGEDLLRCPSPAKSDLLSWPCIRNSQICNGVPDCPNAEDEHPAYCMFHLAEMRELHGVKKLLVGLMSAQKNDAAAQSRHNSGSTYPNINYPEFYKGKPGH